VSALACHFSGQIHKLWRGNEINQPQSTSMMASVTKSFWIIDTMPMATSSAVPTLGMTVLAVALA
jgi:hypothetical protein